MLHRENKLTDRHNIELEYSLKSAMQQNGLTYEWLANESGVPLDRVIAIIDRFKPGTTEECEKIAGVINDMDLPFNSDVDYGQLQELKELEELSEDIHKKVDNILALKITPDDQFALLQELCDESNDAIKDIYKRWGYYDDYFYGDPTEDEKIVDELANTFADLIGEENVYDYE